MKPLRIVWKRLVTDGQTCNRCGDTGLELRAAVDKLAPALQPLGMEPVLEMQEIDQAAFKAQPSESNRVWVAGRPIEAWLGADVGMSRCCSVCGDSDCRTLEVDGRTFETIPQEQIIRAALMAASQLMASSTLAEQTAQPPSNASAGCCAPAQAPTQPSCCGG